MTLTKNVTVLAKGAVSVKSITVTTGTLDISNASDDPAFAVNVSGDVTLSGTGKMYVRAGKTEGIDATDWQSSAAKLWANRNKVNIGGKLTVGAGATLYSANHLETGTPVVFRCAELKVEKGGTISAQKLGMNWIQDASAVSAETIPAGAVLPTGKTGYYSYVFSMGRDYRHGVGYGGVGVNDQGTKNTSPYGLTYGYAYAPFLPGAMAAIQGGLPTRGAGSVVLFVSGHAAVAGTITAAADFNTYAGNSGGGLWLAAATADIADTAVLTVEGAGNNYKSAGGGGRFSLCLGLSESDLTAIAGGTTAEELGLATIAPYGFTAVALGGFWSNYIDRGKDGTACIVYRPTSIQFRSVSGSPSNMGDVTPGYGFHAFGAGSVPEFTGPETFYPDGCRQMRRFGRVEKTEVDGDRPGIVWNFADEEYLLRVGVNGTGSVSDGVEPKTANFEKWIAVGAEATLAASGDGVRWTGDFAGGITEEESVTVIMDRPRLLQVTFADAEGVERTFVGENGGFWDDAGNWDPAGVPTILDDLTIPAGKFVRGINTFAAKSLSVAGFLALGGETDKATTEQNLTDILSCSYGLYLTGDLFVSGGMTLGSRTQNGDFSCAKVGGGVTLSSSGKLAVYAPEQNAEIKAPYAEFCANRLVFDIGGDFAVTDTAVVYPVADRRTGTPIDWEVGGDFVLASGAKVNAENLGFDWTLVADSRATRTATIGTSQAYSLSPGSPANSFENGGNYGGGPLAYGFRYAPFLPGAPSSVYSSKYAAGGGVIWVHANGTMNLAGTLSATANHKDYSGPAGGSVWLLAKKIVAAPTASLTAVGGKQSHGSRLVGAGSGGRIALGIGLKDEEIAALCTGIDPAEIEGLSAVNDITLCSASASGGVYSMKGDGNVTVYGDSGTLATVSGAAADTIITVIGSPLEPIGENGPVYGPVQRPQGEPAVFTASAIGSVAGEEDAIRYNLQRWVVSNATEEVASGTGTTASFTPGKDALTLTWIWDGRETRSVAVANDAELGLVLVADAPSETGAAWVTGAAPVEYTAVPAEGAEFLYWIGDVPFGQTRANPLVVDAKVARRLTAVFRMTETAMRRTWVGKAKTRGSWLDAANWDPAGVPGLDDDIVIERGIVDVTNCLYAGSLAVGGEARIRVAALSTPNNDNNDVNLYNTPYVGTALEETVVSVSRDLRMTGSGQMTVGSRALKQLGSPLQTYHAKVTVGGDLLLDGTNMLQVVAGLNDEFGCSFETGAGWVTVGGLLRVGGKSTVYPICEGYTGGTVVFRAERLVVEAEGTFNAIASGFNCSLSRSPAHHAPGAGNEYNVGAGYGGIGLRTFDPAQAAGLAPFGRTYGQEFAPVHPGSPEGGWGGVNDWGGGLIRLHAREVRIDGTLTVRGSASDTVGNTGLGGSGSGGGIWVTCAGTPVIGPTAKLIARGACRATGAGRAGGGGRIAIAGNVSDAQVAEFARTGTVATWRPKGWHFQEQAKFEAKYPGVMIDIEPGELPGAGNPEDLTGTTFEDCYPLTRGTFWYIEGNDIGLMLLVK